MLTECRHDDSIRNVDRMSTQYIVEREVKIVVDTQMLENVISESGLYIKETPLHIGHIHLLASIEERQAEVIVPEVQHSHIGPSEGRHGIDRRQLRKVI